MINTIFLVIVLIFLILYSLRIILINISKRTHVYKNLQFKYKKKIIINNFNRIKNNNKIKNKYDPNN